MVKLTVSRASFAALLQQLYREQYTGAILLQFGQGVPNEAQMLKPDARVVLEKSKTAGEANA